MRIISGKYGGRKIHPPVKMPFTRPTTDIGKEGLFNILQNQIELEGIKTLDLFGGTGSISYELASRGAVDLTIVEKDPKMAAFISRNLEDLHIENALLVREDVFKYIERCKETFDFIFAGPPYALPQLDDLPQMVYDQKLLKENAWFVLEHTPDHDFRSQTLYKAQRNYGTTVFSIFVNN